MTRESTYDGSNRLKTTSITVSGIVQTTSYDYDKNGNLLSETDWRGNTYINTYDPMNRLLEKKDPYDRTIQKLEYDHNSVQVKSYDALNNLTQYTYDRNNRLLSTIDQLNHPTSQTYDNVGNIATKTDGRNNKTTYSYDEFNRLKTVLNAKNETTSYAYDLNGNMLTQTDGKSNVTTYEYNAANKVVKKIDHGGRTGTPGSYSYDPTRTESYTYNADGSMASKTGRNGNTATYTYDIHGRLLSESSGTITISYTYDDNGNQLTMADGTGTTTRTYDELGRVLTKDVPDIGTSTYRYDIISDVDEGCRKETFTDPKGNVTARVYDRVGRLWKVTADGKTKTYSYYDNGSTQSVAYDDGSREDYTYYGDNLLWTLTNKKSDGSTMDTYTYTYDATHNQTSKNEVINGVTKGTTNYTYDTLNRLLTVTEPGRTTTYTYDASGNRATETIASNGTTKLNTYSYNNQNRLTDMVTKVNNVITATTVYGYDSNGNQLTTSVNGTVIATNTYDSLNRLVSTVTGGKTEINTYDGEGRRVGKSIDGTLTRYLYEYDKVVLETNAGGNQTARNVYGTNLLSRTVDGQAYSYMYNGHGDVTALLDANTGAIAQTYYYDAFGNITEQGIKTSQNYTQNFDGATASGWTTYGGTWTFSNGAYNVASNPGAKSVLSNINVTDFEYEADIKATGTGGNSGIIFRVNLPAVGADSYYGYYAGIDLSAQKVVLGKAANNWTQVATSPMSIVSGQWYHIKVVANGSEIKVFVNDMITPKITVNDSSFLSGSIGVRTYNISASFDNISLNYTVYLPTNINNSYGYAGYQFDGETGLYYLNSRYYDSRIARFLSEDTYTGDPSDPLSLNLYTYCHNEPIMYDDPTGYWPNWNNIWGGVKKAASFVKEGVVGGASSVTNGVIDVLKYGSSASAFVLNGGSTKAFNQQYNNVQKMQDSVNNFVEKNLVTNKTEYKSAKTAADIVQIAAGGMAVAKGAVKLTTKAPKIISEVKGALKIGGEAKVVSKGTNEIKAVATNKIPQVKVSTNTTTSPKITFNEALKQLNKSSLRPGQTEISRSRVMQIVDNYNPLKASSSVYTDSTGRYLVEGHHTTVAAKILGKESSMNMNVSTPQMPSATNVYWTKKWYEFWKTSIKVKP